MKKYVEIENIRESMLEAYPLLQKEYLEKVIANMPVSFSVRDCASCVSEQQVKSQFWFDADDAN